MKNNKIDYNKAVKLAIKSIKNFKAEHGFKCCGSEHGIENININGDKWQVQINITREREEFLPFMRGLNKMYEAKEVK